MKKIVKTFVLLFAMANMISCGLLDPKPTEETDKFSNYRVKTVQQKAGGCAKSLWIYKLSYDAKYNVTNVLGRFHDCAGINNEIDDMYEFAYTINELTYSHNTSKTGSPPETYTLNDKGYITSAKVEFYDEISHKYTYNADGFMIKKEYKEDTKYPYSEISNFTWNNGNLVKIETTISSYSNGIKEISIQKYDIEHNLKQIDTRNTGVYFEGKQAINSYCRGIERYGLNVLTKITRTDIHDNRPPEVTVTDRYEYETDANGFIVKCTNNHYWGVTTTTTYEYIKVK